MSQVLCAVVSESWQAALLDFRCRPTDDEGAKVVPYSGVAAPETLDAANTAWRCAVDWALGMGLPPRYPGIEIACTGSAHAPSPEGLQDVSFGAGWLVLSVGMITDLTPRRDLAYSGVVVGGPEGYSLKSPAGRYEKLRTSSDANVHLVIARSPDEKPRQLCERYLSVDSIDKLLGAAFGGRLWSALAQTADSTALDKVLAATLEAFLDSPAVPHDVGIGRSALRDCRSSSTRLFDIREAIKSGREEQVSNAVRILGILGRLIKVASDDELDDLLSLLPNDVAPAMPGTETESQDLQYLEAVALGLCAMLRKDQSPQVAIERLTCLGDLLNSLRRTGDLVGRVSVSAPVSKLLEAIGGFPEEVRRAGRYVAVGLGYADQVAATPDHYRQCAENPSLLVQAMYGKTSGAVSQGLGSLRFLAPGTEDVEFAKIERPVLLLESVSQLCELWTRPEWLKAIKFGEPLPASCVGSGSPLELHPTGQEALSRFGHGTEFELRGLRAGDLRPNLRCLWSDRCGIWPPSIDALLLVAWLAEAVAHESIESVLDMGCGSGLLAEAVALCRQNVDERRDMSIWLLDVEAMAAPWATANLRRPETCGLPKYKVHCISRRAESWLRHSGEADTPMVDLCVCAPPYLPYPNEVGAPLWRAVSGTDLLESAIENGSRFCKRMIVQFSDIASEAWERQAYRLTKRGVSYRVAEIGVAAFSIPPYRPACEWPTDELGIPGDLDLRSALEATDPAELTPGLQHFRRRVLPNLIDVEDPAQDDLRAEYHDKPFRFYHRLHVADIRF